MQGVIRAIRAQIHLCHLAISRQFTGIESIQGKEVANIESLRKEENHTTLVN